VITLNILTLRAIALDSYTPL